MKTALQAGVDFEVERLLALQDGTSR